eukprot:g1561.t1
MAKWVEVVEEWKAACADGEWPYRRLTMVERIRIATKTSTSKAFVARVMDRVDAGLPLGPGRPGGPNNVVMTDDVVDFIADLYARDIQLEVTEYQSALACVGVHVSTGSISNCLLHTLGLPSKRPYEIRVNKYTEENVLYTQEFCAHLAGVPLERIRWLDEMGSDSRNTALERPS